jgi:hypothetical protein
VLPAASLPAFMFQVALCTPIAAVGFWRVSLTATQRHELSMMLRSRLVSLRAQESMN